MNLSVTEIITERLRLKPISLKDSENIYREFTAEITKYMFPKPPDQIQDTQIFIQTSLERMRQNANLQLIICNLKTEEFLGCVGLHRVDSDIPELGIWLKKAAHGHKYGFEAISGLIQWARQNLSFRYLRYPVDKRNIASQKIPLRLNAQQGKEYKKINQSGFELDEVEYWILP